MRKSTTYEISGIGLKLRDLRQLVEDTKDAPDDTSVHVSSVRYTNPVDPGEDRISVTVTQ